MYLRIYQHLLPRARAWSITISKRLREFFEGLTGLSSDTRDFVDDVWLDIFPGTTRAIDAWEEQFGIPFNSSLGELDRRDRLAARWRAVGGQSPRYIQDTLQDAGFPVYVHQWWVPGTEPGVGVKQCVTPRVPMLYLQEEYLPYTATVGCGEPLALCGESFALAGNYTPGDGYLLVNKIYVTTADVLPLCGETLAECGESIATAGYYENFRNDLLPYVVPTDMATWRYFLYIGGQTFPNTASIPANRRGEFEDLCLQICPAQQWLVLLVEYT